LIAKKRRQQKLYAPGKLPGSSNTFGAGELEKLVKESAIHVSEIGQPSVPNSDSKTEIKFYDYQKQKFAQEKSLVPGPGHYNVLSEEKTRLIDQSKHLAHQRKEIDEKRLKSMTANT